MTIDEAITFLSKVYGSLSTAARGLSVDAKEVADALNAASPDTVEFVCLQALAEAHPYKEPAVEAKPVVKPKTASSEVEE